MYSTNWMAKWIEGGAITVKLVRGKCWFLGMIQCGASGPATSTRIALQFLLNIPVLGRGVNYCIVSPRIKDWDLSCVFLSLPPSITVVSEKDNLLIIIIIKTSNTTQQKWDVVKDTGWRNLIPVRLSTERTPCYMLIEALRNKLI